MRKPTAKSLIAKYGELDARTYCAVQQGKAQKAGDENAFRIWGELRQEIRKIEAGEPDGSSLLQPRRRSLMRMLFGRGWRSAA